MSTSTAPRALPRIDYPSDQAAVAAGYLVGAAAEISEAVVAVPTAFLARGVILNVLM